MAVALAGCGGGGQAGTQSTQTPAPSQPAPPSSSPAPGPAPAPSLQPCSPVQVTWTPASVFAGPAAPAPPTSDCAAFPLTVSSPAGSGTLSLASPAHVVANAQPSNPILDMRVYVDGEAVFFTFNPAIDAQIWMAPGAHTMEVTAVDKKGANSATLLQVNVTGQGTATISQIQNLPGWQSCSAVFPPSSPRAGQLCAAGLGTAVSTMTPNQASPSLSGASAEFTMGGPTGYSNMLYFESLGGGNSVSHFSYDLYFYISDGSAPQALEFDLNQSFGDLRWTWGTECNFNGSGKWDIWDPLNEVWVPSAVDCNRFPSNTWIHLVWNFERVNGQTHYISVSVNGTTSTVDKYFQPQTGWPTEDINVAFQMDGNYRQQPYNVWLDQVTLVAY
ncbi:MAG: hypothetical protein JO041_14390 [Acidobacteria bacterium]|nr:hypothetical protein [Acidobacteriota bacterium]